MSNISQNSQNEKFSQLLQKIAYNQSLDKNPNTDDIIPNILQNSQNDNIAQPLQEIAHNTGSDIVPNISLNSQNYIISEPLQDITYNLDPVIEIASNPSFEQNPNVDE